MNVTVFPLTFLKKNMVGRWGNTVFFFLPKLYTNVQDNDLFFNSVCQKMAIKTLDRWKHWSFFT